MANTFEKYEVGHIGYEYREITVPGELSSLCLDSYPCFGWEQDPHRETMAPGCHRHPGGGGSGKKPGTTLYFRRNRSLGNRAELTRLQRNFDSCIAELQALERSKTAAATIAALGVALLGCGFMAGSTFAVTAEPPIIWLTVLLAIPGFLGWIVPYFLYRKLVQKKTAEVEPLMESKYDEIETLCEKGSRLLH